MRFKKIIIYFLITYFFIQIFDNFSFANNSTEIETYSPSCILIENSTGKILYEKNAYEKMYPASTTKVMTAILTLENTNLNDKTIVSENAVTSIPDDYSNANLQIGEELTIYDLLKALLIPSANDAAVVLAEHIAGSVENFSSMMNEKAIELGCLNTHFVNPNGIHDENHYSTAYDLSLIGRYAMKNDTFKQIVSTTDFSLPATNAYFENNRYFRNSNLLLHNNYKINGVSYYYENCTGIKTGYTEPAKDCIIASASKDNLDVTLVILGADKTSDGLSGRYLDCINLFNYAFNNYKMYTIAVANSKLDEANIINGTEETKKLDILIQDDIKIFADANLDISTITPKINLNPIILAPISKNSVIGKVIYIYDGNEYTANLIAGSNVETSKIFTIILNSLLAGLSIILVILLIIPKRKIKSK